MLWNFNLGEMSIYSFHYCLPNRVKHETWASFKKNCHPLPRHSKQPRQPHRRNRVTNRGTFVIQTVTQAAKRCGTSRIGIQLSCWRTEEMHLGQSGSLWSAGLLIAIYEGVEKFGDFVKLLFFGGFGPSNDLKLEIQCYPTTRCVTGL